MFWTIDCKNQLYTLLWEWQDMLNCIWFKSYVTIQLWTIQNCARLGLNVTFLTYCTRTIPIISLQVGLFELFKTYTYIVLNKRSWKIFLFQCKYFGRWGVKFNILSDACLCIWCHLLPIFITELTCIILHFFVFYI